MISAALVCVGFPAAECLFHSKWRGGGVEGWRVGRVEGWRGGRVEGWRGDFLLRAETVETDDCVVTTSLSLL